MINYDNVSHFLLTITKVRTIKWTLQNIHPGYHNNIWSAFLIRRGLWMDTIDSNNKKAFRLQGLVVGENVDIYNVKI